MILDNVEKQLQIYFNELNLHITPKTIKMCIFSFLWF
jgi:hypothetical protein